MPGTSDAAIYPAPLVTASTGLATEHSVNPMLEYSAAPFFNSAAASPSYMGAPLHYTAAPPASPSPSYLGTPSYLAAPLASASPSYLGAPPHYTAAPPHSLM